jgi:hypothetical protein
VDPTRLGALQLEDLDEERAVTGGQSATTDEGLNGVAHLYAVQSPDWSLTIAHWLWENDSRDQDVHLFDRGDAPQTFDRLRQGLRMSIYPSGSGSKARLDQARIGQGDIPRRAKANISELDGGAGTNVRALLTNLGATAVDTAETLFGDTSSSRGYVWVTFPHSSSLVAPAAYVLSRLLPLRSGMTA